MENKIGWERLGSGLPILALLLGAVIWGLYFNYQYDPAQGSNFRDALLSLDLAQVARRVAEGKGFTTGFIRPICLRFNESFLNHPELTHPPLYILVLAGAIKLGGGNDITLVTTSVFFFWAGLPLVWFFTRKFFDNQATALAIFLYLINPLLLRYGINGSPATFSACLIFFFLYCLYRYRPSAPGWILAAGALAGLGYLTRYSFGLWLLAGILFIFLDPPSHRLRGIVLFLAGALAVSLPWLIRNLAVTGNPFFTLQGFKPFMFSDTRPGFILWRAFSAQSFLVQRKYFFALKRFILAGRDQYLNLLLLTGNFSSVFALTAILHRFPDRRFERLKYAFYLMILLEAAAYSLYYPDWNGLVAFAPFALIIASAFFVHLLRQMGRKRRFWQGAALAFFLLLCLIPISDKLGTRLFQRFTIYNLDNIRAISSSVPPDSILVSDIPWAVAWYGKQTCLWLPYRIEDFEEIRIYQDPPVAGFYLTRFYFSPYFSPGERSPDWQRVYRTGWIPGGWNLKHKSILPDKQIFISRETYP